MEVWQYDGSFHGFLTVVFEMYERRVNDLQISSVETSGSLFANSRFVETQSEKVERVKKKLREVLTPIANTQLYKTFLSEDTNREKHLAGYIRYALSSQKAIESNYAHPDVLFVQQMSRKVHREKHRMEAFVRFQLTKDGIYTSIIQPDYNVLPLIVPHFKSRYADQHWLIYDSRRKYGAWYDQEKVEEVTIQFNEGVRRPEDALVLDPEEESFQQLWQLYFQNVNIPARKNMRLHLQHMPRRYWKHLIEKRPPLSPMHDASA